jgi:hypothetical protein
MTFDKMSFKSVNERINCKAVYDAVANNPTKQLTIQNATKLAFATVQRYLELLANAGLVTSDHSGKAVTWIRASCETVEAKRPQPFDLIPVTTANPMVRAIIETVIKACETQSVTIVIGERRFTIDKVAA